jgi:hypothetical protein
MGLSDRLRRLENATGSGTCPHHRAAVHYLNDWREERPRERREPCPCGLPWGVIVVQYEDDWRGELRGSE